MKLKYPIVSDSDQIIGHRSRYQAYEEKAMLRSVQIFIYNSERKLYIQKRSKNKSRYPSYFCASVAGHVEPGESYQEAAIREIKEELGLKKIENLKIIAKEKTPVGENNYAMMTLFIATTAGEPMTLQKKEIESGEFYSIKKIQQLISKNIPFTPGFLHFFNKRHKNNQH